MDKYKITKTNTVKLTGSEKGKLSISLKKKKKMNMTDLKKIADIMEKKYKNKDVKYYIRAHGNLAHPITVKSFDSEYMDDSEFENYLGGRVKNLGKFEELFSIEIGFIKKL